MSNLLSPVNDFCCSNWVVVGKTRRVFLVHKYRKRKTRAVETQSGFKLIDSLVDCHECFRGKRIQLVC